MPSSESEAASSARGLPPRRVVRAPVAEVRDRQQRVARVVRWGARLERRLLAAQAVEDVLLPRLLRWLFVYRRIDRGVGAVVGAAPRLDRRRPAPQAVEDVLLLLFLRRRLVVAGAATLDLVGVVERGAADTAAVEKDSAAVVDAPSERGERARGEAPPLAGSGAHSVE